MSSLLSRLKSVGAKDTGADIVSQSSFFHERSVTKTTVPIINAAFTGDIDGGLVSGLTVISGDSKTFKSAISLYCMSAYLKKHEDAVAIFYDTEGGITSELLEKFDVDQDRVLHIPVEHIEQLKFDMVKKLDEIKKGDHVFFMVDSIGQISSKKEVDDAIDEKSVSDMTRAKALRSLLRLSTMQLMKKDIPCIMINHVYDSIGGLYPTKVIPGGTAVTYSANQIWIISKSQEKVGTDVVGWNFNINIHKSRFHREKSRFTFQVLYDGFIQKYSGILELAVESGDIIKPSNGWYQLIDKETGETLTNKFRASDADPHLAVVVEREEFKQFVRDKYRMDGNNSMEESEEELPEIENED